MGIFRFSPRVKILSAQEKENEWVKKVTPFYVILRQIKALSESPLVTNESLQTNVLKAIENVHKILRFLFDSPSGSVDVVLEVLMTNLERLSITLTNYVKFLETSALAGAKYKEVIKGIENSVQGFLDETDRILANIGKGIVFDTLVNNMMLSALRNLLNPKEKTQ